MKNSITVPPEILHNARELRRTQTDAEGFLWLILRSRRFCGFKFRRQHPVCGYILDFYCHDALLAIELDGGGHADEDQIGYDAERTKVLNGARIRVLRFWNNDVLKNMEAVLESIYGVLFPSPGASRHPLLRAWGKRILLLLGEGSPEGRMRGLFPIRL